MLAEDEEEADDGVSQSVPSDQVTSQSAAATTAVQDVIVIETDSDSRESKEREEAQQDDEDEEEDDEEEEEEEEVHLCLSNFFCIFSRFLLFGLKATKLTGSPPSHLVPSPATSPQTLQPTVTPPVKPVCPPTCCKVTRVSVFVSVQRGRQGR